MNIYGQTKALNGNWSLFLRALLISDLCQVVSKLQNGSKAFHMEAGDANDAKRDLNIAMQGHNETKLPILSHRETQEVIISYRYPYGPIGSFGKPLRFES